MKRSAITVFAEFIRTVRQEFANGRKVAAERHAAIVSQQDRIENQLSDMRRIVVDAMTEHADHRDHVRDAFDRQGTKLHNHEERIKALELVAPNGSQQ